MSDIPSLEEAISRLEEQRSVLGDDLVDTAVALLREKRSALVARQAGEQRKLVTVLFADLVGFTDLSQRLDPEDVQGIVGAYFAAWRAGIEGNGGVVEKFIGDAVMAVFGLSNAQEDDPQRAICTALEMGSALESLNLDVRARHGVALAMRIGIDTGEVVVSCLDDRGAGFVVVGETVNRAARLQGEAPPGGVLISADTRRHVRGWFAFEPVPALHLKGIATPVDGYLVLAERRGGFWLEETRGVEGVRTSTVGRDGELSRLQDCFKGVVNRRRPQVVTVVGEAGIGKSRLLLELDHWLNELPEQVTTLRGRALNVSSRSPNALLRNLLSGRLDIQANDAPVVAARKWGLGMRGQFCDGTTGSPAADLAKWLGFDIDDGARLDAGEDARALRDRAVSLLIDYLRSIAGQGPVAVLLEDLHWADQGSLDFIDTAAAGLVGSSLMVVATARPTLLERCPQWGKNRSVHHRVDLPALSDGQSRHLLSQLLHKAGAVPTKVCDVLVAAAEGNPFYLEELVTFLLDTDVIARTGDEWEVHEERMAAVRVPPTLRGVLQARVDALTAPERLALQRAAVVGRVFWDDAVASLRAGGELDVPAPAITAALDRLESREVVYERRESSFDGTREFLFKHALLRDVTYDSVLHARRPEYHGRAAQWLERLTARSGRHEEYAEVIASHYDRAEQPLAAASWYLRAGRRAAAVYALDEAVHHLDRGAELAPETEPALLVDLLLEREGVLHRVGNHAAQAKDLAAAEHAVATIDDPVRRIRLLLAQCRWRYHQSDYDGQAALAEQAVHVATTAGLPRLEADARLWWGRALAWRNDVESARSMLGLAIDQARATGQPRLTGEALRALAIVAINAGDLTQAAALAQEARRIHREDGDLEGETAALMQLGSVLYNQGRYSEARTCIEESLPILAASGYRYRLAIASGNLGSVAAALGELGPARRFATEGARLCRELDDKEGLLIALSVLGEVHRRSGHDAASDLLLEALDLANTLASAYVASEIQLNLALASVERGQPVHALRWARAALESARQSGVASSEARARLALGRVLLSVGRPSTAAGPLREALTVADRLGETTLAVEARAALAQAVLRSVVPEGHAPDGPVQPTVERGLKEAVELATAVLAVLLPGRLAGAISPGDVYVACWEVLSTVGHPGAADVLAGGTAYLHAAAALVDDDELYEGFQRVRAHATLAAAVDGGAVERGTGWARSPLA